MRRLLTIITGLLAVAVAVLAAAPAQAGILDSCLRSITSASAPLAVR